MLEQPQLDRLRRDCAARLKMFIAEAHETERRVCAITLPAAAPELLWLATQRDAELEACYGYMIASRQLADFLEEHRQPVQ